MSNLQKPVSAAGMILLLLLIINALILKAGFLDNERWYWLLILTLPLFLLTIKNHTQKKHALLRNYPLIGYLKTGYHHFLIG